MANSDVRVRFAPSPTGYLHVGGVRTALFNWLFARKTGGRFLLRIEDTDRRRSSDEHTQVILDGLRWLGLDWDEDVVFQGAGLERHRALASRLLDDDHTYEDDGAVRFRMPRSEIAWDDIVHGTISFNGADIPDWVILRSDGTPTYNFSVVADDIEMQVTHVLRGDDHISNTPKQIAVYGALGITPPSFGHVPNVHGPDGKKLSKRHGATAVGDYRAAGFLPGALRNFLALLGWSPGNDRELYLTADELIAEFSLAGIQKKSAVFDVTKLEWMNGQHITNMPLDQLVAVVEPALRETHGLTVDRSRLLEMLDPVRQRPRTITALVEQMAIRLDAALISRDAKADKLIEKDPEGFATALDAASAHLAAVPPDAWSADALDTHLRELAATRAMKVGQIMQPIRVALTGSTVSEPVNELLVVVGRDEALRRLRRTRTT